MQQPPERDLIDKVASIVLAGGQGTRLFPLTASRCKPDVSFGGKYRLIDIPLSNSLNGRIQKIFVIAQYFASALAQHIAATYQLDQFRKGSIEILCPEETAEQKVWFKGTADAVRQNLKHLLQTSAEYFLILSGDQLYNLDLQEVIAAAKKSNADMLILSIPVKEAEAKRMGLLQIDQSGRVLDFFEKPSDPAMLKRFEVPPHLASKQEDPLYLGSMGIYVFKRDALVSLLQEEGDDFGRHMIPFQVRQGKAYAFIYDGYWEDIGTIASYYEANLALLKPPGKERLHTDDDQHPIYTRPHHLPSPIIRHTLVQNALISQGAIIEAQEITHSVIGIRAQIAAGTIIRDSIILGNQFYMPPSHRTPPLPPRLGVGNNCFIQKTIIDEHTYIGNNVILTNKNRLHHFDGDGIYIRDGIIIVTSGTQLPDGFTL